MKDYAASGSKRGGRSAAEWFVEIDAGADPAAETELADWLEANPEHEDALARCDAAVHLARRLREDPGMRAALEEVDRPGVARRRAALRRAFAPLASPVLAWSIAGLASAVAIVAVTRGQGPVPADAPAAARSVGPPAYDIALELATPEPAVVLPGRIIVDARSLAVLPFAVSTVAAGGAGDDPAARALAADLYDTLVRRLAAIPGLYVVGRPAVVPYAGTDTPAGEVAAQLGVRGIVEGRIESTGRRIRILLRVTDAANDAKTWQSTFDRTADELTGVETDMVSDIASVLAATAVPAAGRHAEPEAGD
jgi:TolB-like protein